MIFNKLKAGSLQFAIMISAIIAVLLSVFIMFIHSHSLFAKKSDLLIETVQQAENTILYSLHDFSVQRDTTLIVIDEEKNWTANLHRSYWGMFGKIYSKAKAKNKTFEKIALVSGHQVDEDRTALYLKETNRPLIIVGNTKISGKTYLPKRSVRSGTISGNSYYGTQLIYGTISTSSEQLPKLSENLVRHLKSLQNMPPLADDENYIDPKPNQTYTNSFLGATKMMYSSETLNLVRMKLIGNIIIRSETKIKITASCLLKDVILIAPEIEIEDDTKGVFQAIASEKITIGKNCELNYPSALVVQAKDDLESTPENKQKKYIFIDKNTTVKGMVCYLQNITKNRFEPQVLFKENTTIQGFVYCEQQIELLGNVHGSVYTSGFITKQFGSIYQNHIYNGTISSAKLLNEYAGFPLENLDYKVAKWLY